MSLPCLIPFGDPTQTVPRELQVTDTLQPWYGIAARKPVRLRGGVTADVSRSVALRGATGPRGNVGPTGPVYRGPAGATGAAGVPGATGTVTGPTGPRGMTDTGAQWFLDYGQASGFITVNDMPVTAVDVFALDIDPYYDRHIICVIRDDAAVRIYRVLVTIPRTKRHAVTLVTIPRLYSGSRISFPAFDQGNGYDGLPNGPCAIILYPSV